ncbi:MAG: ATP-binding cassette domain-containing protein [Colwellia sp.]|nr:ATP-binding cassette domain-containing protein [Colwellia sp.]
MEYIIETNKVSKTFNGKKILDEISLKVKQGSVYGFLGNNGAGKSTTIRILLGLLKVDRGDVTIFGDKIAISNATYKQHIGCIIDSPVLYEHLNAAEFLQLTRLLKNLPKTEISRVLEIVGLADNKKLIISNYSLGMKQRLAIANSLMGQPRLLILDEPTNGLDPQGIIDVRNLLKNLPEQDNCTVFLSSHLLDEVEKIATDVGAIQQGKMIFQQSLSELINDALGCLSLEITEPKLALDLLVSKGFSLDIQSNSQITITNIEKQHCPSVHQLLINNNIEIFQSRYQARSLEQCFQKFNQQVN